MTSEADMEDTLRELAAASAKYQAQLIGLAAVIAHLPGVSRIDRARTRRSRTSADSGVKRIGIWRAPLRTVFCRPRGRLLNLEPTARRRHTFAATSAVVESI